MWRFSHHLILFTLIQWHCIARPLTSVGCQKSLQLVSFIVSLLLVLPFFIDHFLLLIYLSTLRHSSMVCCYNLKGIHFWLVYCVFSPVPATCLSQTKVELDQIDFPDIIWSLLVSIACHLHKCVCLLVPWWLSYLTGKEIMFSSR